MGKVVNLALQELICGPLTTEEARDVELHGSYCRAMEVSTDAYSLFSALKSEDYKTPTEVSMTFDLMALRESLVVGRIGRMWWINTLSMIADGLTKGSINREDLLALQHNSTWTVQGKTESYIAPRNTLAGE